MDDSPKGPKIAGLPNLKGLGGTNDQEIDSGFGVSRFLVFKRHFH
jgi:hypothetical protein